MRGVSLYEDKVCAKTGVDPSTIEKAEAVRRHGGGRASILGTMSVTADQPGLDQSRWLAAGRFFSALAVALAVGGALFLALVPTSYSPCPDGIPVPGIHVGRCGPDSATLVEKLGASTSVYLLLAVIPAVSLLPLVSKRAWRSATIFSWLLGAFFAYGFATWPSTGTGWWVFLPAAGALTAAAVCAAASWSRPQRVRGTLSHQ